MLFNITVIVIVDTISTHYFTLSHPMKLPYLYLCLLAIFTSPVVAIEVNGQQKIVIAHRGASGYLPEHSMEVKAMAYAMGADYIEQDVVMSANV